RSATSTVPAASSTARAPTTGIKVRPLRADGSVQGPRFGPGRRGAPRAVRPAPYPDLMTISMLLLGVSLGTAAAALCVVARVHALALAHREAPERVTKVLDEKYRLMIGDLHGALADHGDRLHRSLAAVSDSLRGAVSSELGETRESMQALQLAQTESLA